MCRAVTRVTHLSGAAVSLMNEGGPAGIVASSDDVWLRVEELPFILGEGPCWDAFESRRPVFAEDIHAAEELRWPGYCRAASDHGVRAVFAIPLKVGLARLGVLGLYRRVPGGLGDIERHRVLAFAELATTMLIDGQEEAGDGFTPSGVDSALGSRFEVYQAQGMAMVQLGIPLQDAMARLRACAYAQDRTLGEISRDVVARLVVFEREDFDPGSKKGSEG